MHGMNIKIIGAQQARIHKIYMEQLWYNFVVIMCAFVGVIININ